MRAPSLQDLLDEAKRMEAAGRFAEAAAAYQSLLAQAPGLPNSWYNLARMQRAAARPEDALASYARALELGIDGPEEVRLNRGVILSDDLRRPEEAEQELRAALTLRPDYIPALLNLANLGEDRGRRDEATALYERILSLDPRCWLALARYAGLAPEGGENVVARLRAGLADPSAGAEDRADLAFALGRALDGQGEYDEAFTAYQQANALGRRGGGPVYDRAAQEALVTAIIETFTPKRVAALRSDSTAAPLFICGMFRSGSTLTEQILAAHPKVTSGGELELLPRMVLAELSPFPASLDRVAPNHLRRLADSYLANVARLIPVTEVVTDKRLENFLYIGLIKILFPRARVVHTRRDPTDNCLSVFFLQAAGSVAYASDLVDAAHYLRQERLLMAHWRALFGDEVLDFSYDALVREPEPAVARLLAYCGLEWDDACLNFHQLDNAVRTASVWQVREPLHQRSSQRWRNYERHLGPLRASLGDLP